MAGALVLLILAGGYIWWARSGAIGTREDMETRGCATIIGGFVVLWALLFIVGDGNQ